MGLSTTAIGGRQFADCLTIYHTLAPALDLKFLELAIGARACINDIPTNLDLVVHNDWVYSPDRTRYQARLDSDRNWQHYKELTQTHQVLAFSWHFPLRSAMDLTHVLHRQQELATYLDRPFYLELMPTSDFCGSFEDLTSGQLDGVDLCIDLSHLNIWANGSTQQALKYTELVARPNACWHVSTNNGVDDHHHLIPDQHWVLDYVKELPVDKLITYESLPNRFKQFERTDRRPRAVSQRAFPTPTNKLWEPSNRLNHTAAVK